MVIEGVGVEHPTSNIIISSTYFMLVIVLLHKAYKI